jgi:hypothetical protein
MWDGTMWYDNITHDYIKQLPLYFNKKNSRFFLSMFLPSSAKQELARTVNNMKVICFFISPESKPNSC